MDALRGNLYDEFRPQIKMLEELQIDDAIPDSMLHPLVATKKVTQVRAPLVSIQDSQPEILPIEQESKQIAALDLPPVGPLVRPQIDIDSTVYIMKHPLMPWIKGKVGKRRLSCDFLGIILYINVHAIFCFSVS